MKGTGNRVQVTYRGAFGYVTGVLRDGEHIGMPPALWRLSSLLRLRDLLGWASHEPES